MAKNCIIFQFIFSIFFIFAIILFLKGFLLKRIELHERSLCTEHQNGAKPDQVAPVKCTLNTKYKKAILLIIDALKFDFFSTRDDLHFTNKLKYVNMLINKKRENSLLYKFIADPPTTTMQRLKGLTTGSLPTFVDVSSNFASAAVEEDNILTQLILKGKTVAFMGDDTWLGLFPHHFNKSVPFPSLNVKDLDTVDNGVIKHLVPTIKSNAYDVIVAHFLGVDHCGHTFGPDHPKMSEKLMQMDQVIQSVVESIDSDTLLLVFGDHGMTRTGDHGGDSVDELEAGLFVYSHRPLSDVSTSMDGQTKSISQIDIVPTLSLLLGIPIPFSNLGMVVPELFADGTDELGQLYNSTQALRINAQQVGKYLEAYARVSKDFLPSKLLELESVFRSAEEIWSTARNKTTALLEARDKYVEYLQRTKVMCQELWAKFDLSVMALGVSLMAFAILTCFCMAWTAISATLAVVLNCIAHVIALAILFLEMNLYSTIIIFSLYVVIALGIICKFDPRYTNVLKYLSSQRRHIRICIVFIFVLFMSCSFSNSYVVFQDSVTAFLFQSVVVAYFCMIHTRLRNSADLKLNLLKNTMILGGQKKHKGSYRDIGRLLTSPRALLLYLTLLSMAFVRLTVYLRACREEQWTCEDSPLLKPVAALTNDQRSYKHMRYFLSVSVSSVAPLVLYYLMRHFGNLNGDSPAAIIVRYVMLLCYILLAVYWGAVAGTGVPEYALTVPPRLVYVIVLISIFAMLWNPLAIFVVRRKSQNRLNITLSSNSGVPEVFEHLKRNWQQSVNKPTSTEEDPPLVYGLASVYSAAILVLFGGVAMVCAFLLGDGAALGIPLYFLAMLCFLEIHSNLMSLNLDTIGDGRYSVPWSSVLGWCFLVSHFFYATGHQTTVPSIRFEAAFVGFLGDHTMYALPALLIVINTFASLLLGVLALPLLLFWPLSRGASIRLFERKQGEGHRERKGEFILHEKPEVLWSCMNQLCMAYLVVNAAKVLFCMVATAVHRRHLMVWKVFAPYLVYEAASFALLCVLLLLTRGYVTRVNAKLASWVDKL